MSEMRELVRAWFAPSVVMALAVYGIGGVTTVSNLTSSVGQNGKDLTKVEVRVQALETNGVTATAKMAVVESRLDSALKLLERIDARMEARSGKNGG